MEKLIVNCRKVGSVVYFINSNQICEREIKEVRITVEDHLEDHQIDYLVKDYYEQELIFVPSFDCAASVDDLFFLLKDWFDGGDGQLPEKIK